jgi:hypothetical protein
MKTGQRLVVQGINGQGMAISLALPLNDFGKAYDGPPSDPKGFEVQSNKVQDELRKSIPSMSSFNPSGLEQQTRIALSLAG